MTATLDHLVLGAQTLEQGIHYVESMLGVTVPPGGEHPRFGTHNRVMRLGENCYFEIIAVNPLVEPESTPRWFGLDDANIRIQLATSPAIIAWVASVSDLSVAAEAADWIDGSVTDLSRGSMHWQMLVPAAGLSDDPLLPWLIRWPPGQHPMPHLQSRDCSLAHLGVSVPHPDIYRTRLNSIGAESLVDVTGCDAGAGSLQVRIESPKGLLDLPWVFNSSQ